MLLFLHIIAHSSFSTVEMYLPCTRLLVFSQDKDPMEQQGLMHADEYIQRRTIKLITGLVRPLLAAASVVAVLHFLYHRLFGKKQTGLLRRR